MPRVLFSILASLLIVGCGGASTEGPPATDSSELTAIVDHVPVTIRLCEEPTDDSLAAAVSAGFVPQVDADGEILSIGIVVSGMVHTESMADVEAADCVVEVERSDQRVIIAPEAE